MYFLIFPPFKIIAFDLKMFDWSNIAIQNNLHFQYFAFSHRLLHPFFYFAILRIIIPSLFITWINLFFIFFYDLKVNYP